MLENIDYKRNDDEESVKIKLKKINYIYGANGTGKTTTSNGYSNKELQCIYTFNQEFINNNLFTPSAINGTMNNDQSKKFTEIMFGSDLIKLQKEIQSIDSLISESDKKKELLNKTNLSNKVIDELKKSKHTDKFISCNFETIIKDEDIADKIKTFTIGNKLLDDQIFVDEGKIDELFFNEKDNIENYIKNKNNEFFVNGIKCFNKFVDNINQINSNFQEKLIDEIKKFDILINKFNEKKIKYKELSSEESNAIKFVLEKSNNECYVCKNKKFTANCSSYIEWNEKINSVFAKIKKSISDFILEANKSIDEYNNFINQSEKSFQENKEVIAMIDYTKNLQIIFTKINDSLNKNSLIGVCENIKKIKCMEELQSFKDNLFSILLQNFNKELKEYLKTIISRNSYLGKKEVLKKSIENFKPMESESFNFIKKTLKNLDFPYDIKLEKVSRNVTDMGINAQKIIIDNSREVHELSTGERNILALSFFISMIYNSIKQEKDIKTIMIDDPVDSNDSGKVGLVIQEFRNIGNELKNKEKYTNVQWVYLTHNSDFLFASIDPLRAEELKIINLSSSEPLYHEIESKEEIQNFLIVNEKFLWNIINNFIKNKSDETFIRAFCIYSKYTEILENLIGTMSKKSCQYKYKKILDYDDNHNLKESKNVTCAEFIGWLQELGVEIHEIQKNEETPKEMTLDLIRTFYGELDNWNPKEKYIDDLFERNIRYIAGATFYRKEEFADKNRINRGLLRHNGSAYKPMIHTNNGKY